MVQMVRYYRMSQNVTERNAGIVVAFGDWPDRILKHRGWTPDKVVYTRVATESEHDWIASCMRYQAFRYNSVESLLNDEKNVLDQSAFNHLEQHLYSGLSA